jgi:fructooligosaccharide transport system substrate-binding protein
MKKKGNTFLMLLVLMVFCTVIGSASASAVELEVVWMGWPRDRVITLIEQFETENPDIKVDIQLIPFSQLFSTLEVRLPTGTTPDVYIVDGPVTASYAARGYLLPLDEFYSDQELAEWFPSSIESGSYDGKLYSIPYATSSAALYYNKELFDKVGYPLPPSDPDERWTWEDVATAAVEIQKALHDMGDTDVWGLLIEQIDRPYQLLPLAQSLGAEVIGSNGLEVDGCINSPTFVEAATFYWRLFNELKVSPQGVDDSAVAREYFGTGKAAMMLGAEWNLVRLSKSFPELQFGVSPHPYFESGIPVTPTGSWHVGVNSRTEHTEEAVRFVKYMTGFEASLLWHQLHGHSPARMDVYKALPEVFDTDEWGVFLYEMEHTAKPRPATPGYLEYELILRETFNEIHYGADPQEALNNAVRRIQREFRKYR